MSRELVGEPGVSAFLRSVCQNLSGDFSGLEPSYDTSSIFYDPRNDLKRLKKRLSPVQGLLIDAEARRVVDESVNEWMDDIQLLLYDVEDFLDDIKSLSNDQVRAHKLYITSDELKKRLEEILVRTDEIVVGAKYLELKRVSMLPRAEDWKTTLPTRETSSMVDKSKIFHGRELDKTGIVKRLVEVDGKGKKNYDVVGIWGMGGLGKTTLAQQVFNDPEVVKHFQLMRWVCISDAFHVKRAIKELIGESSIGDAESLQNLHQRIQEIVENKRFLVVLDDVWSSPEWNEKWNMIKVPFDSCQNGSKILVTTRDCTVAHVLGDEEPYQLKGLPHEQCMLLFEDVAFGNAGVDEGRKERLMIWGEKIVSACKGVPLALTVIGSMLQRANEEKWRAVAEKADLWDTTKIKDGIHPAIRLSYHYLSASLKRCFECMAVFPPDIRYEQDDVVRFWIAGGLVLDEEGRRAEDIGNEYYKELKDRSLIQENDTMHDIVHHLATVLSRKFCFKENSKEPPASVRHAFVVNQNAMQYKFLAQAPCLRTLDVFIRMKGWKLLPGGFSFLERVTHIRYLAIRGSHLKHFPDSLCMLNNLQFLVFTFCYHESLPDRISSLSNLRHLILKRCSSISSLPKSICALSKLQVLSLHHCPRLIQLPNDIGDLRSLQTLDLSHSSISSLPESICALSQLQVLNLGFCNNIEELPNDIGDLRSLRTLDLSHSSISSLPESICALSKLQVLSLEHCGCLKQLPNDIGNLRSLRELNLIKSSILSLPESFLNVTGLQDLSFDIDKKLSLPIGSLARLEEFLFYHGRFMDRFGVRLAIAMEIVGDVEEAKRADLKSKNFIRGLEFRRSEPGNEEEMEVKIMEALEPHHAALDSLTFSNYGGDKLPAWMMSSNICLSNLVQLKMEGLNKICEMIDMEFVALDCLWIENCPMLRKVLMATPKLRKLTMRKCGLLEELSIHLTPSLPHQAGLTIDIGDLRSLQTLDLSQISISSLPKSSCSLSQLEELPDDIRDLRSLHTLDPSHSSISSLLESICALSQLQVLNLGFFNNIKELPYDIGDLRSLRTLDLSHSSISSLPESICALSNLQVLSLKHCGRLKQLLNDIGNLRSLRELNLIKSSIISLPESFLNVTGLQDLSFDIDKKLSLPVGSLARLEEFLFYHGRFMDRLGVRLALAMENVGGVEEAKRADLRSKNFIRVLEFWWSVPGNEEEMEVKIMEALEPHHAALESLTFSKYGGDKLPTWMMSRNISLSNLVQLTMEGLNKICEMIDMEFVSLESLWIENCPMLRKVLMATPKLRKLTIMKKCRRLEEDSIHLIPSLSDEAGLHSIVSQLIDLKCDYNIFEYFFEILKSANLKWEGLLQIELSGGGRRIASLPWGWPNMMKSLRKMEICDMGPGEFQFAPDGDQSDFPPFLKELWLNDCYIRERVPHSSYTITFDGELLYDPEEVDVDNRMTGKTFLPIRMTGTTFPGWVSVGQTSIKPLSMSVHLTSVIRSYVHGRNVSVTVECGSTTIKIY